MSEIPPIRLLFRSLQYLRPYWGLQLVCLLISVILAVLSLASPWINKILIDDVLIPQNTHLLGILCFAFIGLYVAQTILSILQSYFYARVGGIAVLDLRKDLYNHIQDLSISYHKSNQLGSILSCFTSDVVIMKGLYTNTLVRLITDILRFFVLVIVMVAINPILTLIALVVLPFYGFFIKRISKPVRAASAVVQNNKADSTADLHSNLSGMQDIKAFVMEAIQSDRIFRRFKILFHSEVKLSLTRSLSSLSLLIGALGLVTVIWIGGRQVINGRMQVGLFIAYIGYMGSLFGPVNTFVSVNNQINTALAAANRVFGIMDIPTVRNVSNGEIILTNVKHTIEFTNVWFSYPDSRQSVIRQFSLTIDPGMTVALVGPSGAGKTTLLSLLLRFYEPDTGSITINNLEIKQYDIRSLRRKIGVVFQQPFLFNTSIEENIRFGSDVTFSKIEEAADMANALGFIRELPQGFDTIVGERGVKLSGGQVQRIAISRALVKDPELIIFDEATSAVDNESEALIQESMKSILRERTSIIVAHRLTTVKNADNIVVIDNGSIIETGSFVDLINAKGRFWMLHRTILLD